MTIFPQSGVNRSMAMLRIKAIKDSGLSYWPEEFPISLLNEIKSDSGGIRFASEYQCSPIDMAGNFLKREWLTLYTNPPLDANGNPQLSYYFGVDPSITGTGDYCVICIIGKSLTNKIYIIDFVRKQARLEEQVNMINREAQKYLPKIINIESNAAQELFIQHLESVTTLPLRRSMTRGRKADRFAAMSTHFQNNRVYVRGSSIDADGHAVEGGGLTFHEKMREFFLEWVSFRPGTDTHDDTLDALEKALEVATFNLEPVSINADPPSLRDLVTMAEEIRDLRREHADAVEIARKQETLDAARKLVVSDMNNAGSNHMRRRRFHLFR